MTKIVNYDTPYIAHPVSRTSLRLVAEELKKKLNISVTKPYVDVVMILDRLSEIDSSFNYEIVEDWQLDEHVQAMTNVEAKTIYIKSSVYEDACQGIGKDRMSIAHEIGHILLHRDVIQMPVLYRYDGSLKLYQKPEWQAECFAAELLMPYEQIKNMSVEEIMISCGVSRPAAIYQKSHI
ncbi:hypothetical protein J2Z60_001106 [Lactobacillus colini]|uniref:IrrE N-terminal-like domain-containing protein n=1 Tax=Lactobacillus colini TaxID=1819254 RepID=A0ABS4MF12_9LACO|nr:ImmA/IrrE family metallo-endopeptidase [Lactobacillus colini]MBP2057931.1 hypothetical protein [Lactobacillus colini]